MLHKYRRSSRIENEGIETEILPWINDKEKLIFLNFKY